MTDRRNQIAKRLREAVDQFGDDGVVGITSLLKDAAAELEFDPIWPAALTPELRSVLGMMCFDLGPLAHAYQAAGEYVAEGGEQLKKRAEDEQAFMLHRFVGLVVEHGGEWRKHAAADLERVAAIAKAGRDAAS